MTTNPLAVADDQEAKGGAQADQNEALLTYGIVGIILEQATLVGEHGLRLLEADMVVSDVGLCLGRIPLELELHTLQCSYTRGAPQGCSGGAPNTEISCERAHNGPAGGAAKRLHTLHEPDEGPVVSFISLLDIPCAALAPERHRPGRLWALCPVAGAVRGGIGKTRSPCEDGAGGRTEGPGAPSPVGSSAARRQRARWGSTAQASGLTRSVRRSTVHAASTGPGLARGRVRGFSFETHRTGTPQVAQGVCPAVGCQQGSAGGTRTSGGLAGPR